MPPPEGDFGRTRLGRLDDGHTGRARAGGVPGAPADTVLCAPARNDADITLATWAAKVTARMFGTLFLVGLTTAVRRRPS